MISAILSLALQALTPGAPLLPVPVAVPRSGGEEKQSAATPPLTRIRRSLGQALYQLRPWLAHERGWSAPGIELGSTGPQAVLDWTSLLEDKIREIQTTLADDLSPPKRAEYESLLGWVRTEHSLVSLRGTERRDPVSYVEHVDRTLRAVVASDALSKADRAKEVSLILLDLPKYWSEARRTLSSPAQDWSLEAMPRVSELARWMETELVDAIDLERLPARLQEIFEQRLEEAVDATLGFQGWLVASPARSGELVLPLEEGEWTEMVWNLTGTELDAKGIKLMLLEDIAELDGGLSPTEASASTAGKPDPKAITDRIRTASRRAMGFVAEQGLVSRHVNQATRLQARVLKGRTTPGPAVRLRFGRSDPRSGYTTSWLDLEPGGFAWSEEVNATRRRLFTIEGQRAIGIRYGFPGEMLLRFEVNSGLDPDRGMICNRATMEGWGLYTLDWLPRVERPGVSNPYAQDDELLVAFEYSRLLEAARLLASLELHHEQLPQDEVTDAFARRTGFDPVSAAEEIRMALHDPLYGIGYLGYYEMRVNERLLAGSSDAQLALVNNVRAIFQNPHLRPADMRENLFPYVVATDKGE